MRDLSRRFFLSNKKTFCIFQIQRQKVVDRYEGNRWEQLPSRNTEKMFEAVEKSLNQTSEGERN